jgi:hypothetical protein
MLLGLGTATLVLAALVGMLAWPSLRAGLLRARAHAREWHAELARARVGAYELDYDAGRERRAERRARALLRSCVNEHEWAMYRDLGFLRVPGRAGASYAYLIYPHRPIVSYVPRTGALLSEYCVAFPDHSRPYGSARLPDSDDVLAKWMALRADERGLIAGANMHLPGRQVDPELLGRDLARLAGWERARERMRKATGAGTPRDTATAGTGGRRADRPSPSGCVPEIPAGGSEIPFDLRSVDRLDGLEGLDGWNPDNVRAA